VVDGGPGSDTAVYAHEPAAVIVDLKMHSTVRAAGRDSLPSIENLTGSRFADKLFGDSAPNVLTGGPGDDKLVGRGGKDTIAQ
jgi:Ca2+-binding RTX toxin-like protein